MYSPEKTSRKTHHTEMGTTQELEYPNAPLDMPHTNHHSRTDADRNVVAELKSGQFPHGNKLKPDDNRREIGRDPQYR
jgi:hypothetical protein